MCFSCLLVVALIVFCVEFCKGLPFWVGPFFCGYGLFCSHLNYVRIIYEIYYLLNQLVICQCLGASKHFASLYSNIGDIEL